MAFRSVWTGGGMLFGSCKAGAFPAGVETGGHQNQGLRQLAAAPILCSALCEFFMFYNFLHFAYFSKQEIQSWDKDGDIVICGETFPFFINTNDLQE